MSYDATRRRLDALTDHVSFQDLVTILLARTGVNVRPLGGPGDRGAGGTPSPGSTAPKAASRWR
jgi:hypothetical protein